MLNERSSRRIYILFPFYKILENAVKSVMIKKIDQWLRGARDRGSVLLGSLEMF